MIPEYLFKQAEREANAAMMKELYAEGSMEPAVAGMDPEQIDPEVAAAINTILGKIQKPEESEKRHTVEKASSLRDCILKMADFDPNKDYGHLKADDIQIPETTWFENLANSAPVSALLDAAEATGVDRWAGDIYGTIDNIKDWNKELSNIEKGELLPLMENIEKNEYISDLQQDAIGLHNMYNKLIAGAPHIGDYFGKPKFKKNDDPFAPLFSRYQEPGWKLDFPQKPINLNIFDSTTDSLNGILGIMNKKPEIIPSVIEDFKKYSDPFTAAKEVLP